MKNIVFKTIRRVKNTLCVGSIGCQTVNLYPVKTRRLFAEYTSLHTNSKLCWSTAKLSVNQE